MEYDDHFYLLHAVTYYYKLKRTLPHVKEHLQRCVAALAGAKLTVVVFIVSDT